MSLSRIAFVPALALAAGALAQDPSPPPTASPAQDPSPPQDPASRVDSLEAKVEALQQKLDAALGSLAERDAPAVEGWQQRMTLGGYGESHANFTQGSDNDFLDHHRWVLYLGYRFADWIHLHSETELEHSLVEDGNGELSLEQLHTDLTLCPLVNVRLGRSLVPVGITNERHEPTTFWGVERPTLDRVLIPTTWSIDGIGLHGEASAVQYQLYVGSGLDGSQFDDVNGIRDGRLKERPGIHEPGLTGRVQHHVLAGSHDLRLGASFFASGLDNRNRGTSGADGTLQLYSSDLQYRCGDVELRGVYVWEQVSDAGTLNAAFGNGVASRLQGWYAEAGWHWWPSCWKQGKLADADAVLFARYEDLDTQDKMPAGYAANPAGERREWTFGLAWYLTHQFVLKADWQVRDDDTADGLDDLWNLGVGWRF